MQKILILFVTFAALATIIHASPTDSETKTKYFIANPKSLDYKFTGNKDEHRFGVELKENRQFHHTKTAEDGVRLGCYGHELEGKKYSTHYVADGKGYRLVPHQGLITVYPKDGGEPRKASFVQSFNEEDIVSANIRYFFPEGCQSPQIEIDPEVIPEKKPAEVKVKVEVQRPKAPQEKKTKTLDFKEPQNVQPLEKKETDFEQPAAPNENNLISVKPFTNPTEPPALATTQYQSVTQYQPSTQRIESIVPFTTRPDSITRSEYTTPRPELTTFFNVPTTEFITARPETTTLGRIFKSVPLIPEINRSPNIPVQIITPYKNAKKCSDTCCDDNRPQILLSRASSDSCCKGVGKIVLPIDMELLAKIGTDEIIQITSISSNTEMLKKLLKLVEKYNF